MNLINKIYYNNEQYDVLIVNLGTEDYSEVLKIRAEVSLDNFTDIYDDSADIYVLKKEDTYIATMRFNQARRGKIDCEDFYPQYILEPYRNMIGSSSRFARTKKQPPNVWLMREFLATIKKHQILDGIRIDFINVNPKMIHYYKSIGYKVLCNSFFLHPRLKTPSYVMCAVADGNIKSPVSENFLSPNDYLLSKLSAVEFPICSEPNCIAQSQEELLYPRFSCYKS